MPLHSGMGPVQRLQQWHIVEGASHVVEHHGSRRDAWDLYYMNERTVPVIVSRMSKLGSILGGRRIQATVREIHYTRQ